LIPDPPEVLDEDKFAERMIQLVNVTGDNWNGDGLNGYENPNLFRLTDINQHVFSLSVDTKEMPSPKRSWLGGGVLAWIRHTRHSSEQHRGGYEHFCTQLIVM
jgi:hypothetical protein